MTESIGVQPGQVLAGKYRVDRVLGVGGMGVVVAATHVELDQRVALKFMLPEALQNAEAVQRFLREARAAVKLRSEHVARVSDVGRLETGAPYIVMEFLEGKDLGAVVAAQGPLPVETAVSFVLQACEALAEAHAVGIVHRDLKPANLFLTSTPTGEPLVKILDFGISKLTEPNEAKLTKTAAVMGSPGYMSPEQLRSAHDVDARADIWALGVILYELVAGTPPFVADTFSALCLKITLDPTPPLLSATVPPAFAAIVYKCLEKEPAQRYASVAELAAALGAFGDDNARRSSQRVQKLLAHTPPAEPLAVPRPSRGRRTLLLAIGAVVVSAGLVTVALLAHHGEKKPAPVADVKPNVAVTPDAAVAPPPAVVASSVAPTPPVAVVSSAARPKPVAKPVVAAPAVTSTPVTSTPASHQDDFDQRLKKQREQSHGVVPVD